MFAVGSVRQSGRLILMMRLSRSMARRFKLQVLPGCECDWCRTNKIASARKPCAWCGRTACPAACEHWAECRAESLVRRARERERRLHRTITVVRLPASVQDDNSIFKNFDNAIKSLNK